MEDKECRFCGENLEEDTDVMEIEGQLFCCHDHAAKWKKAEEMRTKAKHCC